MSDAKALKPQNIGHGEHAAGQERDDHVERTPVTPEEFKRLKKVFGERVPPNDALRAAFARHRG